MGLSLHRDFWGTWVCICILILGDVGLSLDFVFWGVGSVYSKLGFVWGWGWFYFEFLGDYFFLRDFSVTCAG